MKYKCPTCDKLFTKPAKTVSFLPFCCERCKLIDLGAWLDGEYRISSKQDDEDIELAEM